MYHNIHKYSDPGLMFICLAPNNWTDVGSTTSDPTWSNQPVHIGCRRGLTMWRLLRMMMGDVSPNISSVHLRMVDLLWKLGTLKLFFAVLNGLFRASCCHLIIAEKAPAVLYKFKCIQCITSPLLQQLFSGNTVGESICNPRNLNPILASQSCLKLCPEKLEKYDSLDDVEIWLRMFTQDRDTESLGKK